MVNDHHAQCCVPKCPHNAPGRYCGFNLCNFHKDALNNWRERPDYPDDGRDAVRMMIESGGRIPDHVT